jgi:hypothetical protein
MFFSSKETDFETFEPQNQLGGLCMLHSLPSEIQIVVGYMMNYKSHTNIMTITITKINMPSVHLTCHMADIPREFRT